MRSQTNKSKVQVRNFTHRQNVATASYNTTSVNDQPADPQIVNSGNSGVFRRQINPTRGSLRLPNRGGHNKMNAPASISLDKKHADLMSPNANKIGSFKKSTFNSSNVQNQNIYQVSQTRGELPSELIVSSYSKHMNDSQNQQMVHKKSASKFA